MSYSLQPCTRDLQVLQTNLFSHTLNLPSRSRLSAAAVVALAALPGSIPCSFTVAATPTFTRRLPLGTSVALCSSLLYIYVRLSAQRGASAAVNVLVCRCSGTFLSKLSGWDVCNHVTLCVHLIDLFTYSLIHKPGRVRGEIEFKGCWLHLIFPKWPLHMAN